MRTLVLHDVLERHGARMTDTGEWRLPAAFGDVIAEVEAVHARAGVADVSHYGHFTLHGKESVRFLQGLVTNDVANLTAGNGVYASFLNVHGRIETDCYVFSFGDMLVIQTPSERTEWVATSLGKFRYAGDFHLTPLAETHAALTVQGPEAGRVLETALGVDVGALAPFECHEVEWRGERVRLLGTRRSAERGVDLLLPASHAAELFEALVAAGAVPIGSDALDILRMEAGIARYGRDFDDDTVLQEVDTPEIVNFNKGCYLGQEVVARLHFLGQPSKLLRRLDVGSGTIPVAGDALVSPEDESKAAGRVTSVAVSPTLGPIVFAVVKRKYYEPGTPVLVVRGEDRVPAVVLDRKKLLGG